MVNLDGLRMLMINWTYVGKIKNMKPFEASLLYKHCSKVIKYPINWNDLKVDWKLIIG